MKFFIRFFRLIQINYILARYGLDEVILSMHLFRPLRFFIYLNPWNWGLNRNLTRGQRIRLAFEALGPIFVKFGQTLSTRKDLLPEDIADELAHLQDKVPPFPSEEARKILEKTYGKPINEVFQDFDMTPLASASIAQVHAAKLLDGKEAVVKVLRPNVLNKIKRDVDLMYVLAGLAERYWAFTRRLKPLAVVAEFEHTLLDELNLQREAANASQLRRNFLSSPLLYIPEVYWSYSHPTVLVMERIYGIPISDIPTLKSNNINLKVLAERGVEIFFTQVFRDCFFHADMHPGNIFVSPQYPEKPQYLGVDFGIMGSLSPFDQRYIAENLLAFFNRDYRRIAALHIESGWVPGNTRLDEFEGAIRTVCEPIFERPLKEISFGQLLLSLFQAAERFNMEIQPQLVLLEKTLFNIEGLGRQLYPELDLWSTAKPFLEHWLKQQVGLRSLASKLQKNAPYWVEKLPDIPDLIYNILTDQQALTRLQLAHYQEMKPSPVQKRKKQSLSWPIGAGCILILWALLNSLAPSEWLHSMHQAAFSWGIGIVGLLFLLLGQREG